VARSGTAGGSRAKVEVALKPLAPQQTQGSVFWLSILPKK